MFSQLTSFTIPSDYCTILLMLRNRKATAKSGKPKISKKIVKTKAQSAKHTIKKHSKRVAHASKTVHHHVAVRPHNHLTKRWTWYEKWHLWKWHKLVNLLILIIGILGMLGITFQALAAPNDTKVWTFETPAEYSYSASKVEPDSNNLRLKLQDAVSNFSVASGHLQSDNVLDVAADDTYYFVSTDLGIDVIRQDTWVRSAYIVAGGGFVAVDTANDYLYAGKNGGIFRWQISTLTNATPLGSARYTTSSSPALGDQNIKKININEIDSKVYLAVTTDTAAHIIKDEQGSPSVVKALMAGGSYKNNGAMISDDGALYYDMRSSSANVSTVFAKYDAIDETSDWAGWTGASVDYGYNWASEHGPDPSYTRYTDISVTSGTSTANSGDNTIYVGTEEGLFTIQENRTNPADGIINNYFTGAEGSNLISGSSAKGRFNTQSQANQSIDGNEGSYYIQSTTLAPDWLEYNLGSSKTFNQVQHSFWNSEGYTPSDYVIETSTQGTTENLSPSATPWGPWEYSTSYNQTKGNDDTYNTAFLPLFYSNVMPTQLYELTYPNPETISAVDMQFYDQNSTAKDYVIEGSTSETIEIPATTATSSSVYQNNPGTYGPLKAIDGTSTRWSSSVPTDTAPQWLQLDFGSSQPIEGVSFVNEGGYTAKDFSIDYSDNGVDWTSAYSTTNNNNQSNTIKFSSPVNGRYMRLYVTTSGAPTYGHGTRIMEMQAFSSMFESGTVTELKTETNNSDVAKQSTFNPTSVKSIRIRATNMYGASAPLRIREMKTFESSFEGGTVNQVGSVSGLSSLANITSRFSYENSFGATTSQYFRVKYTGYDNGSLLIGELQIHNSSLPEYFPTYVRATAIDYDNDKFYSVHNTTSPEDGKILRIDGVNVNSPTIGQTIDVTTTPDLASDEFTSLKFVDSNKMITGTTDGASFIGKRYGTDKPTIEPNDAYAPAAVASWKTFSETASKNGGEIYYQISNNDGTDWYYWNGTAWVTAGSGEYNTAADINTNINDFDIGDREFKWRAYLDSNGDQAITLTDVTLEINPDVTPPASNASNITMFKSNGGAGIAEDDWTNDPDPYFAWDAGTDDANPGATGIKGYCLYLGTDNSADPVTTKGLLGSSPLDTDGSCPFAVSSNSIDLSTSGLLGTALTSSNTAYTLSVKALDYSNNVFSGSSAQFDFKYDNTAPAALGFISGPSQFIATRDVTLTWPTSGSGSISDANSGVIGLQYKLNDGTWYGDNHNGAQDATDLLVNDGSYTTDATFDYPELIEGNNIIYFRTLDLAGNFSNTNTTAVIKINTASPSSPNNVVATPSTNTLNSFAFDWDPPSTFVGPSSALTYCYTVNTLPTVNTCTYTSAGEESLVAGAYATQPGTNTFYVVAKDEAGNINYDTYASATFTANTTAPGMPLDLEIADISTKATSNWKVALSWTIPSNVGAGVSTYRIYRSTDNVNFIQIASTSGVSYVDAGLAQQKYYYKLKACDSANNCGAYSATVNMLPTGKFTEPAKLLSKPVVSNITTKRAKIAWVTNRESDSKIAIGTSRGQYNPSEISNSDQITTHNVSLDNLDAGTTYYYVARWTDGDGNTGVSDEGSFQTAPAPVLKEVNTLSVGLSNVTIQFTTKAANVVDINFGKSDSFGGIKSINTSASESTYGVDLTGLDDGVKYFYKLTMYDSEGGKYQSSIFSFTTLPRPRISQLQFQPVQGEPTSTQKVSWVTNVPASSQLTYSRAGISPIEKAESKLVTNHEITIRDLADDSEYSLVALSRDGSGNLATSERQTFKTALDTRPPKISDISVEKTVRGTGSEARGQIVVTWKTDEPATSQVKYTEGSSSTELNNQTIEDGNLTLEHVSIISDLSPSKAYNIQPVSRDKSSNQGEGGVQSVIITRATDSVISIIFNTLQRMFGFGNE